MKPEQQLINRLFSLTDENKLNCIAMCGAADLGKSYLTRQLVTLLQRQGKTANVLPLDSYLMPRQQRIELDISGYEIHAYNVDKILEDLNSLRHGKSLQCFEYDHTVGKCIAETRTLAPCSYLFLDGLQSLNEVFSGFIDASIFIRTSDSLLQQIRHKANLVKRGQSETFSKRTLKTELQKYKINVEPLQDKADIQLVLKRKWRYELVEVIE